MPSSAKPGNWRHPGAAPPIWSACGDRVDRGAFASAIAPRVLLRTRATRDARYSVEPSHTVNDVSKLIPLLLCLARILTTAPLIVLRLDLEVLSRCYLGDKLLDPRATLAAR